MEEIKHKRSIHHIQSVVNEVLREHTFEPYNQETIDSIVAGIELELIMLEMSGIILNSTVDFSADMDDSSSLNFVVRYQPTHTQSQIGFSAKYTTEGESLKDPYEEAMKVL